MIPILNLRVLNRPRPTALFSLCVLLAGWIALHKRLEKGKRELICAVQISSLFVPASILLVNSSTELPSLSLRGGWKRRESRGAIRRGRLCGAGGWRSTRRSCRVWAWWAVFGSWGRGWLRICRSRFSGAFSVG